MRTIEQMLLATLFALGLSATGCAAILAPKTTAVTFESQPSNADVYVDGARVGATPTTALLSNQSAHVAVIRKAGYQESSCRLNQQVVTKWLCFDLCLGLAPVVIDAATNSWNEVTPPLCSVTLVPATASRPPPPAAATPAAPPPPPPPPPPADRSPTRP